MEESKPKKTGTNPLWQIPIHAFTVIAYSFVFMSLSYVTQTSSVDTTLSGLPGTFLASSAIVCLVNMLIIRCNFKETSLIKSFLINLLLIGICFMLGKMEVPFWIIYNQL